MENQENTNSPKHSLLSDRRDSVSSLNESRGIILENPDGTYHHGVLVRKLRDPEENKNQRHDDFSGYPRNRIVYVVDEDEIALYARFSDIPTRVDSFIEMMMLHQTYFKVFIFIFFVLEVLILLSSFESRTDQVRELMKAYKSENLDLFTSFYNFAIFVEFIYQIIYYVSAISAVVKKTIRVYGRFALISLIGIILQMTLSFANRFSIATFLLRFIGLIYARFINQLLMSLLLLPR